MPSGRGGVPSEEDLDLRGSALCGMGLPSEGGLPCEGTGVGLHQGIKCRSVCILLEY